MKGQLAMVTSRKAHRKTEELPPDMVDAALDYAKQGWPIFPCRFDKTPYTEHGVHDATTTVAKIEKWWAKWPNANIGLDVGGAGMMVIDLDPGHDFEELERNVGPIPDTLLRASTPRGGEHLFFHLAAGEIVSPSASKLAPHVDVRSHASYVLLHPSRTEAGTYIWTGTGKPAYRTDEMLRLANSGREKHKDRNRWIIEPNLPENIELCVKWLREDARVAIDGQGGDITAYATAAMCRSFGISEDVTFDLMWEHWNSRCSPPWDADNVGHFEEKVRNGHEYCTSPPGNMTPAYRTAKMKDCFDEVHPDGSEIKGPRFRFVDRHGVARIRPPEWLVPDFLPEGSYAILIGAYSTFKTFVALDLALTIAAGMCKNKVWPGYIRPGPILFTAGEGRSQMANRIAAWEKVHHDGMRVKNLILGDPVPSPTEPQWLEFIAGAKQMRPEGYQLVVLDTVGRSLQGMNENSQEDASAFTNLVQELQRELGCCVLALHHIGHGAKNRARGSSVFGADADTMVRLDRENKSRTVSLTMIKQKDAPEWGAKKYLKLITVDGTLVVDKLADSPVKTGPKDDKVDVNEDMAPDYWDVLDRVVVAALKKIPDRWWTQKDLAAAVAGDASITTAESTLAAKHFKTLRADNNRAAWKCYAPFTTGRAKWRYMGRRDGNE